MVQEAVAALFYFTILILFSCTIYFGNLSLSLKFDCGGLGLDCLDNCYIYPDESSARLLNVRE